ncbi:beta-1,3-galactosyltransferase 5-like [Haliotis cracherodii]|uniref:beta-1,3-galactosyltransferase 5-like n=1 Tax=Haliotis cracherodii TaxID=6455 RepID=UPI0039E87D50
MTIVQQLPLMFLLCCQTCVLLFLLWRDMAPDVKQWTRAINDEHTCHCNVTGCGDETIQHQKINRKSKRNSLPQYIDERDLRVILGDKTVCGDVALIHAVFVVHSAVGNYPRREIIRQIFRRDPYYKKYTIRLLFLFGQPHEMKLQDNITQEFRQYGDIVQGVFLDTYHNLTYKAVMGMKWISQNCRNVKYIVKMDDDVIVDLHNFFTRLYNTFRSSDHTIICYAMIRAQIFRKGKWGVEKHHLRYYKRYPFSYCSGFAVVMPAAMIPALYKATLTVPFFWIDDIYLFGMVRRMIPKSVLHDSGPMYFDFDGNENLKCFKRAGCKLAFASMGYNKMLYRAWKEKQKHLNN